MNYKPILKKSKLKIAIWGAGYIGLSTMGFFFKNGVKCVRFDINKKKIEVINSGRLQIKELKNWLSFNLKKLSKKKYSNA